VSPAPKETDAWRLDASERAVRIVTRVAGVAPERVSELGGGLSNAVFEAETPRGALVVRLGEGDARRAAFERGRRAMAWARAAGVPVPNVIAVGQDGTWAYSVAERAEGHPATQLEDATGVPERLGRLAAVLHAVRTAGHGSTFTRAGDTDDARPQPSWRDFLFRELEADARLRRLHAVAVLQNAQHDALAETLDAVARWDAPPVLNHGDLRLKNVLVDAAGGITALIDWDDCVSSIGPHWDLSVALHDLTIDAKQSLLAGYGMPEADVRRAAPGWRLLNVLNYVPELERLLASGDHAGVERLRTRLSGALDLFGAALA
jgi:hygromycin-B 4-O-kinase